MRGWFERFLETVGRLTTAPLGEAAVVNGSERGGFAEMSTLPRATRGAELDAASLDLHQRACRFIREHPRAAYSEALRAVFTPY
jgi:hypothetical protein